jgi:hypothetical protein
MTYGQNMLNLKSNLLSKNLESNNPASIGIANNYNLVFHLFSEEIGTDGFYIHANGEVKNNHIGFSGYKKSNVGSDILSGIINYNYILNIDSAKIGFAGGIGLKSYKSKYSSSPFYDNQIRIDDNHKVNYRFDIVYFDFGTFYKKNKFQAGLAVNNLNFISKKRLQVQESGMINGFVGYKYNPLKWIELITKKEVNWLVAESNLIFRYNFNNIEFGVNELFFLGPILMCGYGRFYQNNNGVVNYIVGISRPKFDIQLISSNTTGTFGQTTSVEGLVRVNF